MSCISAKVTRIGGDLIVLAKRQEGSVKCAATRIDGNLIVSAKRQTEDIKCIATRIGGTIKISTSLICAIDPTKKFIRVTPKFIWLTESNNYTEIVNVLSNTDWTVK